MDRRTFMRAVAASTGSAALAGCLDDEENPVSEFEGDGPQRYDLPAYSELTPTETASGRSMVFVHLRLSSFWTAQQAASAGRLTDEPLAQLPLASLTAVPEAVETIAQYPFVSALREAVNEAAIGGTEGDTSETTRTVVDPLNEVENGTSTLTETENGTESVDENQSTAEDTTTKGTETDGDNDIEPAAELPTGIEVAELTLIDGLVVFHGTFDPQVIADRYTEGFEQVDRQRGMRIYESTRDTSERGFAVSQAMFVVPTANSQQTVAAQTVLAHSLSSYLTTLGRIRDDEDGKWLFEVTGSPAVSIGVWGADDSIGRLSETVGSAVDILPAGDANAVFGSVGNFISALELPTDETNSQRRFEAQFAGLFPEPVPTEDELRAVFGSEATDRELTVDETRITLNASFDLSS